MTETVKRRLSKADKEALAFAVLLITIMAVGTAATAIKEHWRNTSCAALGGIVVDLKCGQFSVIEGWKP